MSMSPMVGCHTKSGHVGMRLLKIYHERGVWKVDLIDVEIAVIAMSAPGDLLLQFFCGGDRN